MSSSLPSSASVPLREIVIDRGGDLHAARNDAEIMDVAQTSNDNDGNGPITKIDGTSQHQPNGNTTHTNDANETTIGMMDEEVSLKLRKMLSFNKRGSVDTSTTIDSGSALSRPSRPAAPREGRRFSVDTEDIEQDQEKDHQGTLSYSRSTSLRSLGEDGASANLREQLHSAGGSKSMRSLGRRPSLRRRHSICYSIPPSSVTTVSSEQPVSNNTASSTRLAPDRRASMSCADARSVSLSSIITECHPLSMGLGNFSDDSNDDSDDDSSVGSDLVADRS